MSWSDSLCLKSQGQTPEPQHTKCIFHLNTQLQPKHWILALQTGKASPTQPCTLNPVQRRRRRHFKNESCSTQLLLRAGAFPELWCPGSDYWECPGAAHGATETGVGWILCEEHLVSHTLLGWGWNNPIPCTNMATATVPTALPALPCQCHVCCTPGSGERQLLQPLGKKTPKQQKATPVQPQKQS